MFPLILSLFCVATVDAGSSCCDGTYSSSEGSGTCSWHGGVCETTYKQLSPEAQAELDVLKARQKKKAEQEAVGEWSIPQRVVVPGGPGQAYSVAYWTMSFGKDKNNLFKSASYTCFGTDWDQVSLIVNDNNSIELEGWFTTKWVFTYSDDSVLEYSIGTTVEKENGQTIFTSGSEIIESQFISAVDVTVVWKEGGNSYYTTWDLKGSGSAVAATKAKCKIK